MPQLIFVLLLALTACGGSDAADNAGGNAPDPSGWRLASGKPPTGAEFTAVVATCQDKTNSGSLDGCLADLGLRRAP